jgi:lipoate-protein ligase A
VNEPIRLLALGTIPWLRTQALYHALAAVMTEDTPDTLILARTREPYVCIGYHQSVHTLLDRVACRAAGLPIVRRRMGGGTTYLDQNQQFYQCVFHHKRLPFRIDEVYAHLLAAPVAVLHNLGLSAELRDGNEIEVAGRRIAGTGGGRIGEAMVVVGNILLDFDYAMMARVWRVPSEDFRRCAYQAMQQRITTLWSSLPQPVSADEVQAQLAEAYAFTLKRPLVSGSLTEAEQAKVAEVEEMLTSESWLYLHSQDEDEPLQNLKISLAAFVHTEEVRVDRTLVNVTFFVHNGVIEQAILTGDLGREKKRQLENRLVGVSLKDWHQVVHNSSVC